MATNIAMTTVLPVMVGRPWYGDAALWSPLDGALLRWNGFFMLTPRCDNNADSIFRGIWSMYNEIALKAQGKQRSYKHTVGSRCRTLPRSRDAVCKGLPKFGP